MPLVASADGTYSYIWDVSQLPSPHIYHLRVTVKDATGQTVFSDSRAGVTVFHARDLPDFGDSAQDLSVATTPSNSGCAVGESHDAGPTWIVCVLALVAVIVVGTRRSA